VGDATGAPGDDLRARYGVQIPFMLDIGAKFWPNLYLGVYMGFGIGSEGADDRVEDLCEDNDSDGENQIECSAATLRVGIEGRYYFAPAASLDPWLAYGIGIEAASQRIADHPRNRSEETTATGIEFARLGAGFDWRAGRVFGIGPLFEVAAGRYTNTRTEVNGQTVYKGAIEEGAVHAWLTLGMRGVFFP
jgi:hypothetical protein